MDCDVLCHPTLGPVGELACARTDCAADPTSPCCDAAALLSAPYVSRPGLCVPTPRGTFGSLTYGAQGAACNWVDAGQALRFGAKIGPANLAYTSVAATAAYQPGGAYVPFDAFPPPAAWWLTT